MAARVIDNGLLYAITTTINPEQVTLDAIANAEKYHADEMQRLRETITQLKSKIAA